MSEKPDTLTQTRFGDVPRTVFERAVFESKRFSTALFLNGEFAGSGTFIKWGEQHGILTAHHVVHNPHDRRMKFNFSGTQDLALQIEENREHWFEIPLQTCRCVDIGEPVAAAAGPDLSVIVLPEPRLGTIKAKKDFYNISTNTVQKLQKALCDYGFFIFAGSPASKHTILPGSGEHDQTISLEHGGTCTSLVRRYDEGSFDFIELKVSYHLQSEALESYKGMSGGGVWRIPLFKPQSDPIEKVTFNECILAGVTFYQTEIKGDECRIRCHGGKSIFVNALQVLMGQQR